MTFDELTVEQQRLLTEAEQAEDSGLFLRDHPTATPSDRVVVAQVLGGPAAGEEFRR